MEEELIKRALHGDAQAMDAVRKAVLEIVNRRNGQLCRKFCYDQYKTYLCTLNPPVRNSDTPLCDRGNQSFEWIFGYLTHRNRLKNFLKEKGGNFLKYVSYIAYSRPFFEKWKDNRFSRRIRVPYYIQVLHDQAEKLFYYLYDGDDLHNIAQRLGMPEKEANAVVKRIEAELIRRRKLHILYGKKFVSLEDLDQTEYCAASSSQDSPEDNLRGMDMDRAWQRLTVVERFIIHAMDVEDIKAPEVLRSLQLEDMDKHKGKKIKNADQVYYIRNKVRAKLKSFMET